MSLNSLPSVESLVHRIKGRIKYPHCRRIIKNYQRYPQNIPCRSSVKELIHDEQIADMPVLVWEDNENYPHQIHRKQQQSPYNSYPHNHNDLQNEISKQTVRNLIYCEQLQQIPRVPHRKHQGDMMKTLIYNAHYADYPSHQPDPINYDHQYMQNEKIYYQQQSHTNNLYRQKSKSVIAPKIQRDRLGRKKQTK